ncbi:hypothetical protein R6242_02585 [Iodobacter sp. CM08]|uniref:hypothetical protein n=1 Tax=Iodobacter sp. CM08 TaxID=3085902 RepID=UPI00298295F8|nr:hypothetical protein [Iodobacter sp. CM08]MDW5415455.1 hypothetical protein [Iodobacter sp. CM08]
MYVREHISRVIDGKTYNTRTALNCHMHTESKDDQGVPYIIDLYRTKKDQYFLVEHNIPHPYMEKEKAAAVDVLTPISLEQAEEWVEKYCPWRKEKIFSTNSEANLTTLTLRIDKMTKAQLVAQATKHNLTLNAYCLLKLEKILYEKDVPRGGGGIFLERGLNLRD